MEFWFCITFIILLYCTECRSQRSGNIPNQSFSEIVHGFQQHLKCYSCLGKCGKELIEDDDLKAQIRCRCDEHCFLLGNCCPDIFTVCPQYRSMYNQIDSLEYFTSSVSNVECHNRRLIVNTCPSDKRICEVDHKLFISEIPVVDRNTGLSYRNIFCAHCNGAENILPWNMTCKDTKLKESSNRNVTSLDKIANVTCERKLFEAPIIEKPGHQCVENITERKKKNIKYISTCSKNWTNMEINNACTQGKHFYLVKRKTLYKNYFCAVCNDVFSVSCNISTRLFKSASGGSINIVNWSFVNKFISRSYCVGSDCPRNSSLPFVYMRWTGMDQNIHPCSEAWSLKEDIVDRYEELTPTLEECRLVDGNSTYDIQISAEINVKRPLKDITTIAKWLWKQISMIHDNSESRPSLLISLYSEECNYTVYGNMSTITSDAQGYITVKNKGRIAPGHYHIRNGTLLICEHWLSDKIIATVTIVFTTLSVLCLIVFLCLRCFYPYKVNRNIVVLACCLLVCHLTFLVAPLLSPQFTLCYIAAVVLHWSFLLCFSWMMTISINVFWAVHKAAKFQQSFTRHKGKVLLKTIAPFMIPTLVVIVSVSLDNSAVNNESKPHYATPVCWLNNGYILNILFVVPVAIYLFITTLVSLATVARICYVTRKPPNVHYSNHKMFLKLFALTGLNWTIGFIAFPTQSLPLFIIFVVLTASQGVFILLAVYLPVACTKCAELKSLSSQTSTSTSSSLLRSIRASRPTPV